MSPDFHRCTPGDIPRAASTLAAAFADYSWTRWTVPAEDHLRRLEELQAIYLAHAVDHGVVLVDAEVTAVIALVPPDAPELSAEAMERVVALHGDRLEALGAVSTPLAPEGSWELATLGVDPGRRGQGLGSAITTAGIRLVDELAPGAPIALETSDERNVRLYEGLGFVVTGTTVIEHGPTVFSMLQDAR